MLCGLCQKKKAVINFCGEVDLGICVDCRNFLYKKNIRNHYGGQLYEFVRLIKYLREAQQTPKVYKAKMKKKKVCA